MRKISRSLISCLFIAVLCFAPFFSGCEALGNFIDQLKSGYSVYFTDSAITLEKGEQRTFSYKDLKFEDIDGRFDNSRLGRKDHNGEKRRQYKSDADDE